MKKNSVGLRKSGKIPITAKSTKFSEEEKLVKKLEFRGHLFDFQKKVIDWSRSQSRGIIGLDMGLGKTVIMITIICERNYDKTIVVLPLQLLQQWNLEFQKFSNLGEKEIINYHGKNRNSLDFSECKVVITTYDIVRIDMNDTSSLLYRNRKLFNCIVLDEAH